MAQISVLHKFGFAIEPIELGLLLIASWPAIITSIIISAIGIVQRKIVWLSIGSFLYIPFTLYLFGTPRFWYMSFLLPLLHLGAILALKQNIIWLAWLFLSPVIIFTGWFAFLVYWQGPY